MAGISEMKANIVSVGGNVCNMYHEPRIIPAGYIRSSRFDGPDMEF